MILIPIFVIGHKSNDFRFMDYKSKIKIKNHKSKTPIMAETYNEAVEKLRKIVADIENGDLDVDILSEKVKEATRLIKLCKEKLYKADEEVKKVLEELE